MDSAHYHKTIQEASGGHRADGGVYFQELLFYFFENLLITTSIRYILIIHAI
jgi:hypothetical protein